MTEPVGQAVGLAPINQPFTLAAGRVKQGWVAGGRNEQCSDWASGLLLAALILLAPVIGFAVVVAAQMVTDLVTKLGGPAVWPVAAGAVGFVLLRKYGWQPRIS